MSCGRQMAPRRAVIGAFLVALGGVHAVATLPKSDTDKKLVAPQSGVVKESASTTVFPKQRLGTWAYYVPEGNPMRPHLFTANDFIVTSGEREVMWQNIMMVVGGIGPMEGVWEYYANVSAEILQRTGTAPDMVWTWDPDGSAKEFNAEGKFKSWMPDPTGTTTPQLNLENFGKNYNALRETYPHLPEEPFAIFMGDEPDLAKNSGWLPQLKAGCDLVKKAYPNTVTYLNDVNVLDPNIKSNWEVVATALGQMQLDWFSMDDYYAYRGVSNANGIKAVYEAHLCADQGLTQHVHVHPHCLLCTLFTVACAPLYVVQVPIRTAD